MKLVLMTLALDAAAFLPAQFFTLNQLKSNWMWVICEGTAANGGSTSWCAPQQPRLSKDGTGEFLSSLAGHPRIKIHRRQTWASKDEMCQVAVSEIKEDCCLIQVDADEIWRADQLDCIGRMFDEIPDAKCAFFFCRYFVGGNIIITHESDLANNRWKRAWRGFEGMKWKSHEPPVLTTPEMPFISREETFRRGLVFDHFGYLLPSQLAFKESYYKYKNAVANWQRLQRNTKWPVRLRDFLPWAHSDSVATPLHK